MCMQDPEAKDANIGIEDANTGVGDDNVGAEDAKDCSTADIIRTLQVKVLYEELLNFLTMKVLFWDCLNTCLPIMSNDTNNLTLPVNS